MILQKGRKFNLNDVYMPSSADRSTSCNVLNTPENTPDVAWLLTIAESTRR